MPVKLIVSIAIIATVLPIAYVVNSVGGIKNWEGVPPQGVTDSLVYYARMHEVSDGYPRIGNPFVYEYRESYSPGFFIPDDISALPVLIGIPFTGAIVFNLFFWTLMFLSTTYLLGRMLRLSDAWIVSTVLLVYLSSYAFMLRPTVMQIIFPLFIAFLVALLALLRNPYSHKQIIILSLVSSASFYCYNFLAFFVFVTLALLFLWYFFQKQYAILKSFIRVGVYTTALLVPFFLFTFFQTHEPLYLETLIRMGLVYTHIPTIEAFFFGRWVFISLVALVLIWYFFPRKDYEQITQKVFWVATGIALLATLFLNVVTGVEFTLAIHMGRFVTIWMALALMFIVREWYVAYFDRRQTKKIMAHTLIAICVTLLTIGVARNLPRGLGFFSSNTHEVTYQEVQEYAGPLNWLEHSVAEESVIWANESLSGYIPIMTKHYPLFHTSATQHLVPDIELEERYLLWRSLGEVSIESLKDDFELLGAGREKEQPLAYNNRVRICSIFARVHEWKCPQMTKPNGTELQGELYFEELLERFKKIKSEQSMFITKYNVSYLIVDTERDVYPLLPSHDNLVYSDGRFDIYATTNRAF